MKNLKLFVFALVSFMIIGVTGVNAKDVATAEEFINAVVAGGEVKVTDNLKIDEVIEVTKDVTIDLNGKTIEFVTSTKGDDENRTYIRVLEGHLNLTGTGKMFTTTTNGKIVVVKSRATVNDKDFAVVTVGKNVTLEAHDAIFVDNNRDQAGEKFNQIYGVTVNVYGTLSSKSNASLNVSGNITNTENAPVINIYEGANLTSYDTGIYGAGYATYNIYGGTIYGEICDGIEVRSGKLNITGGTISTDANVFEVVANGNGTTTKGAALAISQHNTKLPIEVNITDGSFKGKVAFSVANPQNNSEADYAKVELNIAGGKFETTGDKTINSEGKTEFIAGGTFSTDVKDYIKDGYVSTKVGDTYKVLKESKVTLGKVTAGNVKVDKTTALEGEKVTLTLTPNEGYELSSIKVVDTYNKEVSVTGNTFVMPNSDVTITVVFTKVSVEIPVVDTSKDVKDVTVGVKDETKVEEVILDTIKKDTELASKIEDKDVTVEVEIAKVEASNVLNEVAKAMEEKAGNATIATYFDVTIALKDATGSINETISELSEEIELVVLLPEELKNSKDGMTRKYYIVREHTSDNKSQVDLIEAKLSEDGKYLVFKTNKFSTYAIAYEDVANVENPKTFDNVMLYVALGFMSVLVIGYSMNCLKKRKAN